MKKAVYQLSKEKAVQIAMKHNNVSRDVAENYTDSELREVLKSASGYGYTLKLKK